MRFERKYKLPPLEVLAFKNYLKSKNFEEIYSARIVNSIYYDTNDLDLYYDSVAGIESRKKIRIRYYENNKKLNMEYKIKKSDLGYKEFPKLENIYHGKLVPVKFFDKKSQASKLFLPSNIESTYFPKIFIKYNRRYFYSKKFNVRITIDKNLFFSAAKLVGNKINIFLKRPIFHNILEIKYERENILENNFDFNIAKNSNLILQRSSKYCDAIETVYN